MVLLSVGVALSQTQAGTASPPFKSLVGTGCEPAHLPAAVIAACTTILERDSRQADALAQRGSAHRLKGDTQAALNDLNAALAIAPDNVVALSYRVLLHAGGRFEALIQSDIDRIDAKTPTAAADYGARGLARLAKRDYPAAIVEMTMGLKLEPTNAVLLANRAQAHMRMRDADAAKADCDAAIAAKPDFASAYGIRGLAQAARKRFALAEVDLDKAVQLDPRRPSFLRDRGLVLLDQHRYQPALSDLDLAIDINPSLEGAHVYRARLHLEMNALDKALADIGTALALNPRDVRAFSLRGRVHSGRRDHLKAINDFSTAIEIQPKLAEAWYGRGAALMNSSNGVRSKLEIAARDLDKAIELAPQVAANHAVRAEIFARMSEHERAVTDATQALTLDSRHWYARLTRGQAYTTLKQYDKALEDLNAAVDARPNEVHGWTRRGALYAAMGDEAKAQADRQRAANLAPPSGGGPHSQQAALTKAWSNPAAAASTPSSGATALNRPSPPPVSPLEIEIIAAEVQVARGEYDLAIASLDRVLAQDPRATRAYVIRGFAFSGKNDYPKAIADLDRAIAVDAKSVMAHTYRCLVNLSMNSFAKAVSDCDRAIELAPQFSLAYLYRGMAQRGLGAVDRAAADIDKAIGLGFRGGLAHFERGMLHALNRDAVKATAAFKKVLEIDPQNQAAIRNLRMLTDPESNDGPLQVRIARHADAKCGSQCAEWIAMDGRIDANAAQRVRSVLRALGDRKLPVFIDSGGGDLNASIEIGRLIRARGLDVYVTRTEAANCSATPADCQKSKKDGIQYAKPRGKLARCASGCTNILAAGTKRSAGLSSLVGVHRAGYYRRTGEGAPVKVADAPISEAIYVRMRDYFVEMGVDASVMLKLLGAAHETMHWLTRAEIENTRLANQTKSGEELITGAESQDGLVASPQAVKALSKAPVQKVDRNASTGRAPAAGGGEGRAAQSR